MNLPSFLWPLRISSALTGLFGSNFMRRKREKGGAGVVRGDFNLSKLISVPS